MIVLAGDVGGTKTNLALYEKRGSGLIPVRETSLQSRQYDSLEAAIGRFLESGPRQPIDAACLGVAGPVVEGRCVATNLPWIIDEQVLSRAIPAAKVRLLNDLEAAGYGVLALPDNELKTLQAGVSRRGNIAVIAAGTGLGEAVLYWDGHGHRAAPSEGGSADFAPRSDREIAFLTFLKKRLTRVSCEELFSGRGFRPIHEFLAPDVRHASFERAAGESAQEITQNALTGACSACVETLDFWTDAFGAESGNLALRVLAYGGVYLAGGIAVKILPLLQKSTFCTAFADKGPLGPILQNIPIAVVLNEDAPILGAAYAALRAAS